jgi:hypothetical protein
MRVLGLIGLVLALLIVGVLVKKQTQALVAPASSAAPSTSVQQGRQLQQDIQKSLDAAMQPPRSMPDESP